VPVPYWHRVFYPLSLYPRGLFPWGSRGLYHNTGKNFIVQAPLGYQYLSSVCHQGRFEPSIPTDRRSHRQAFQQNGVPTDILFHRQVFSQTSVLTDKRSHRQAFSQTGILTDRRSHRHAFSQAVISIDSVPTGNYL
jgi:hypothetical protein